MTSRFRNRVQSVFASVILVLLAGCAPPRSDHPVIGAKIYSWVRDHKKIYRGEEGARVLLERQLASIKALKAAGVTLKINTIIVPGINDEHVELVAEEMRELGADVMNCIPLFPVAGTPFAEKNELPLSEVKKIRTRFPKSSRRWNTARDAVRMQSVCWARISLMSW